MCLVSGPPASKLPPRQKNHGSALGQLPQRAVRFGTEQEHAGLFLIFFFSPPPLGEEGELGNIQGRSPSRHRWYLQARPGKVAVLGVEVAVLVFFFDEEKGLCCKSGSGTSPLPSPCPLCCWPVALC